MVAFEKGDDSSSSRAEQPLLLLVRVPKRDPYLRPCEIPFNSLGDIEETLNVLDMLDHSHLKD